MQCTNCLRRGWLDRIGHGQHPCPAAVNRDKHDGAAFPLQLLGSTRQRVETGNAAIAQQGRRANEHGLALHLPFHASARDRCEVDAF
jgi:hypothetical protein